MRVELPPGTISNSPVSAPIVEMTSSSLMAASDYPLFEHLGLNAVVAPSMYDSPIECFRVKEMSG